jgi:glycosyltransferase involved in cell wall biosynthesis
VPESVRPAITVAIPTCNGSRHLPETLRSILGQEDVPFELLVSDDRSDDDTVDVVRALVGDKARIELNSERLGLAGNWNRCVARSETPFVAIVHQDDVLRPGHLAAHVGSFAANPAVGLVASASGVIDDSGRDVPETVVGRGGLGPADQLFAAGEATPLLAAGNPLRCSAVSTRAAAHAETGGFDPSLRYVVDWDFWLRIAERWGLAWLGAVTVDVRWHEQSETHRFKTGTADIEETEHVMNDVIARLRARGVQTRSIERSGRARLARAYLNRAYEGLKAGTAELARRCLTRAVSLRPGILGAVARDPRLAVQMTAVLMAPRTAVRWFSESSKDSG